MALKKQATPKRWRSKQAKEIVAAVQWAGGAHRERASEGHRASRFRHRRLSSQHRPRWWARRPQHPGDDQEQDWAAGVNPRPSVAYRSSSSLSFWRLAATASRTRGTATRPSRRPRPRSLSSTEFVTRVPSGMASRASPSADDRQTQRARQPQTGAAVQAEGATRTRTASGRRRRPQDR